MNAAEDKLALECYGYGRWDAPYWFIGLEQGQDKEEKDDVNPRYDVFTELNKSGLCDSAEFHNHPEIDKPWHNVTKPLMQGTWKSLILLLKAYLNEDTGLESRRVYQQEKWGRASNEGETCVIELRGLPANGLRVSRNRELYTDERIAFIKGKMPNPYPTFVVMYGKSGKEQWSRIAGNPLTLDVPRKIGETTFLFVLHPTDFFGKGVKKNDYYAAQGKQLARAVKLA